MAQKLNVPVLSFIVSPTLFFAQSAGQMTSDNKGPPKQPTPINGTADEAPKLLTKRKQFSTKDRMAIICHAQRLTENDHMTRCEACK
jgi:hypothetical protein